MRAWLTFAAALSTIAVPAIADPARHDGKPLGETGPGGGPGALSRRPPPGEQEGSHATAPAPGPA